MLLARFRLLTFSYAATLWPVAPALCTSSPPPPHSPTTYFPVSFLAHPLTTRRCHATHTHNRLTPCQLRLARSPLRVEARDINGCQCGCNATIPTFHRWPNLSSHTYTICAYIACFLRAQAPHSLLFPPQFPAFSFLAQVLALASVEVEIGNIPKVC